MKRVREEEAQEDHALKRTRTHSPAWEGVMGSSTLLGSAIVKFLDTRDTVVLIQTGTMMRNLFDTNPTAFKKRLSIRRPAAFFYAGNKGDMIRAFLDKVPQQVENLFLNISPPAGVKMTEWLEWLHALLLLFASRCRRVNSLMLRSASEVHLDTQKFWFEVSRLALDTTTWLKNAKHGLPGLQCLDVFWFNLDASDMKELSSTPSVQSVLLHICTMKQETEESLWRECTCCAGDIRTCFLVKGPFWTNVRRLELHYTGAFKGETDADHLTAKDIHKLFPNIQSVELVADDASNSRPEKWIKEDLAYFRSVKGVAVGIEDLLLK